MSQSSRATATSTTQKRDEIRIPRPVVAAAIELPEEEMWRFYLRINKYDMKTPVNRALRLSAVLEIGDFVVCGEDFEPLRYILVTQSKWFHEGYLGMPEGQIPFYRPGKCEEQARLFLQKCKVRRAAELPYRDLLLGEDPSLY